MHADVFESEPPKPRSLRRRFLRIALILVAVVALRFAWIIAPVFLEGHPKVTVGPDTTYVLGPLRDDGYVDYLAALNEIGAEGVTQENNAATPLIQFMGDADSEKRDGPFELLLFEKMGIDPLPEKDRYRHVKTFLEHGDANPDDRHEREQELYDRQELAQVRPWNKDDFPVIYEWIQTNNVGLDRMVEATRRPRFHVPTLAQIDDGDPPLISCLLTHLLTAKSAISALRARAMLRVDEADFDAARQDVIACHRLARLVCQGPSIVEWATGVALARRTVRTDCAVAYYSDTDSAKIANYREQLAGLPAPPAFSDKLIGERLFMLDAICGIARGRDPDHKMPWYVALDYDVMLRYVNEVYDRVDAIGRINDAEKRDTAYTKVLDEVIDKRDAPAPLVTRLTWGTYRGREALSQKVAAIYMSSLLPSLEEPAGTGIHLELQLAIADTSMGLAQYRKDNGRHAESLTDLVPKYLDAVPTDWISVDESPIRYRREGEGYVIWSVGYDGIDNDGDPELDYVIRMPVRDEDHLD